VYEKKEIAAVKRFLQPGDGAFLTHKRALILYYSHTHQTRLLVKSFSQGLSRKGVEPTIQPLEPVKPYEMPFRNNWHLLHAMVETFFCRRMKIQPLPPHCFQGYDAIILAGPTWSYQPSGPMLSFLDLYGAELCAEKEITLIISCRSYWRIHWWQMKRKLAKIGATVSEPLVFVHPVKEPYRFIGLLLQLRGKMVMRKDTWFRRHYPGYGHSKAQLAVALSRGEELGRRLTGGQ
jgi:hypothetical protein